MYATSSSIRMTLGEFISISFLMMSLPGDVRRQDVEKIGPHRIALGRQQLPDGGVIGRQDLAVVIDEYGRIAAGVQQSPGGFFGPAHGCQHLCELIELGFSGLHGFYPESEKVVLNEYLAF